MTDKAVECGLRFSVTCAWCGALIRRSRFEDAQGTCLRCFYRMYRRTLQLAAARARPTHASER